MRAPAPPPEDGSPPAGPATEPATVTFTRRVRPGREREFTAALHDLIAASRGFPGNLGAVVLHEDGSQVFHVVSQFTDRRRLRAWLDSPERHAALRRLTPLVETEHADTRRTGLETWFDLPGLTNRDRPPPPPPRWKMLLVTLAAAYPLVLLFQWLVFPAIGSWPLALRSAAFPVVLLTLMTYVVMPRATRLARRFLYPEP